jgi:hypothetical protein
MCPRDPKHFQLLLNWLRDGWCALPPGPDARQELYVEMMYYQVGGEDTDQTVPNYITPEKPSEGEREGVPLGDAGPTQAQLLLLLPLSFSQMYAMEAWARMQVSEPCSLHAGRLQTLSSQQGTIVLRHLQFFGQERKGNRNKNRMAGQSG